MKKLTITLLILICITGFLFTQEQNGLILTGELKTGLFWYRLDREGQDREEQGFIYNSDSIQQAGKESLNDYWRENGRLRLNFLYDIGDFGVKFGFETTRWPTDINDTQNKISWAYAFAFGDFFNNNLRSMHESGN